MTPTCTRDGCAHGADQHTRTVAEVTDACAVCDCGGMKKPGQHDAIDGAPRRICNVTDLVTITSRRITDEGYLVAPATIARIGIQEYRARELGMTDGDPERIVRLYRPASEVMAPQSLASFNRQPVTLNHPPDSVNAANWHMFAVGDVHDVLGKDGLVAGEMIVRDKAAVEAVDKGKAAISNGYGFELDLTPGKTAEGLAYDGVQRSIRGNHVAIVDKARGGPVLRIADSTQRQGETSMAIKKVIDDITFEFADDTQASVIARMVDKAKEKAKDAKDAAATAEARSTAADTALGEEKAKAAKLVVDHDAAVAKLVADHAAAIAKLTADHTAALAAVQALVVKPEQIEALAIERAKVVGDAVALVPEFKAEGKTVPAIRAEILTAIIAKDGAPKKVALAVLGGVEIAKASEPVVRAAFDAVAAIEPERAEGTTSSVNDAAVARALAGRGNGASPGKLGGRDLMIARMKNGGKPLPSETAR